MKKGVLACFFFIVLVQSSVLFEGGYLLAYGTDYQEVLISYYTQQLVSHGVMLFAACTATFGFTSGLIKRTNNRFGSGIIFVFINGILFGLVIFLGFRLLEYGALASAAIHFPIPSNEYIERNISLGNYTSDVSVYSLNETCHTYLGIILNQTNSQNLHPYLRNFLLRASINFDWDNLEIFNCFFLSIFSGFFITYLIFYAFGCHSLKTKESWFFFIIFLIPPIILGPGIIKDCSVHICGEQFIAIIIAIYLTVFLFDVFLFHKEEFQERIKF
jgi:hypothetical protein